MHAFGQAKCQPLLQEEVELALFTRLKQSPAGKQRTETEIVVILITHHFCCLRIVIDTHLHFGSSIIRHHGTRLVLLNTDGRGVAEAFHHLEREAQVLARWLSGYTHLTSLPRLEITQQLEETYIV